MDPAQLMRREEEFVNNLYKLDNLEAEDLQHLLSSFDEGEEDCDEPARYRVANFIPAEAYLRAETSTAGLEVAASCPPRGPLPPIPVNVSVPITMTDLPCAELDGTEQILGVPIQGLVESRSVSPFPGGQYSRPISPSPVSPLGTILDDDQLDEMMDFQIENTSAWPPNSMSKAPFTPSTIDPSMLTDMMEVPLTCPSSTDPVIAHNDAPLESVQVTGGTILYATPDHLSLPVPERGSEFLENSSFQTTEARVQEVRALVDVINREWIERMTDSPRLLSRCAGLSTSLLFEKGVTALQLCFRGRLPDTFFELFGLAHVALAIVYTFHRDDDWCRWEEMFNDLLNWQHVLEQDSERTFFLDALRHLQQPKIPPQGWLKQLNPSHRSVREARLSSDFTLGVMQERPLSELISDPVVIFDAQHDGDNLLYRLRQGRVMRDCATFLDGKFSNSRCVCGL